MSEEEAKTVVRKSLPIINDFLAGEAKCPNHILVYYQPREEATVSAMPTGFIWGGGLLLGGSHTLEGAKGGVHPRTRRHFPSLPPSLLLNLPNPTLVYVVPAQPPPN